ncbi:SNF2-related protein [Arthrobacter sp. SX1312]|uniref:DEAD/DEAH box helicase n=1 Tax=Arthrobacter sp. SX1312 TaxID=2058896 RepID=UPI000CE30CC6|nr:SNF2-related protein [Arthrobacter sp. SX1312]
MPISTHPMVDVTDIIRIVGGAAFQRGQTYAKDGAVSSLAWDAESKLLTGKVRGTAPHDYRTKLRLGLKGDGRFRPLENFCSCPIGADCKHVAATALQSNTENLLAQHERDLGARSAPRTSVPEGWQASLTDLLEADTGVDAPPAPRTPLGLQFELRTPEVAVQRWGSAAERQGQRTLNTRLGVRPVSQNGKGKWIKNNLSWGSISYQTYGLTLDPDQHRWFSQFPALHRGTGVNYFGNNDSWLYLDDFSNPLLWQLLDEAQRLGIAFVGSKKSVSIDLAARATLKLDATETEDGSLRLSPALDVDGRPHPSETAHVISTHGIYTVAPDDTITLAPASRRLTAKDIELLQRGRAVVVPEEEKSLFLQDYYPKLRQSIQVDSSDGSVELPEIQPPALVLTTAYGADGSVALDWHFDYTLGDAVQRRPFRRGGPGSDDGYREPDVEDALAASARQALGPVPIRSLRLEDMQAVEFVEDVLPRLAELDGVSVEVVGDKPDYRELTETPTLRISTVETDDRDWFDLGVMVTVSGRTIPFDSVFRALAQGQKKLKLVDNSYLSLDQPVFDQLRELIEEARALSEWDPDSGLQISRYQAGLWADLEDLAEETEQAQSWRDAVSGLLELEDVAATPAPAGLVADMRPYQAEGFSWLAFLWRHRLGGVLADDMGLGKTLQALALMIHAKETSGLDAPFIVVAPTSVVPNWSNEARRFAPGLKVVAISDTQGASGIPIDEQVGDADVVITSYTLFRLDFPAYQDLAWSGLVLDEAQFVKNRASKVHQAAKDFDAPFKLAITGTPMENNLMELWSLFNIVAPGLFPSARKFTEDYRTPIEKIGDNRPLVRLRKRIRPLMMRRTKEAVASDLPPKQEQVLEVELHPEHRHIYETYLQRERQKLLGLIEDMNRNRMIVFRSLTLLRMLSLDASLVDPAHEGVPSAKLEVLFENLEDVLAEGHRALVFSQFTSYLKKAAEQLDARGIEYAYLDGSTRSRGEVIDSFKDGKAPVFLISLKAGGFGLNLTEADYCFLLDPWWNPASEAQAVDRTHRIGQTKNVMVYRMVSKGTIEEKVMKLKEKKAKLFTSVMDDDAIFSSALTADDIRGLLDA